MISTSSASILSTPASVPYDSAVGYTVLLTYTSHLSETLMIVGLEDNERVGVDETTVLHAPHFEHQTYRIRLLARVAQNIQRAHRPSS